jgi:hypothetical protein
MPCFAITESSPSSTPRRIPTRGATPSTAWVPQQKVGFPITNPRLLLGFQGTKTARREGISSPFSDAGGCTSRQNSGAALFEVDRETIAPAADRARADMLSARAFQRRAGALSDVEDIRRASAFDQIGPDAHGPPSDLSKPTKPRIPCPRKCASSRGRFNASSSADFTLPSGVTAHAACSSEVARRAGPILASAHSSSASRRHRTTRPAL